jgi:uncharacterized protein YggE
MKSVKMLGLVAILVAMFAAVMPVAAQDPTPPATPGDAAVPGTITVYGSATAEGAPDEATLELGVDVFTTSVSEAFEASNDTVRTIVEAIVALGVAEEDIQTANLSVYSTSRFNPESSGDENGYQVSNTVRVKVRDIELVDDIINAGISNGATSLYGIYFTVADSAPLETVARQEAVAQANSRATELAALVGATIGEVVSISEDFGGNPIMLGMDSARAQGGGGNAFVAPGQTSVTVGVVVTFRLVR